MDSVDKLGSSIYSGLATVGRPLSVINACISTVLGTLMMYVGYKISRGWVPMLPLEPGKQGGGSVINPPIYDPGMGGDQDINSEGPVNPPPSVPSGNPTAAAIYYGR